VCMMGIVSVPVGPRFVVLCVFFSCVLCFGGTDDAYLGYPVTTLTGSAVTSTVSLPGSQQTQTQTGSGATVTNTQVLVTGGGTGGTGGTGGASAMRGPFALSVIALLVHLIFDI
jgi:hypothetical protein